MERRVILVLAAGSIDFAFQQTLGPALPAIQTQFGASTTATTWLITAFVLAAVVALPLAGPIGDRYGRRRAFIGSLAAFAAGSVVCALAGTIGVMIAGRVLQGLGAGVAALALAIAKDHLPPPAVPRAVGFLIGAGGIGGVAGLLLTGMLVDHASTGSVFWMLFGVSTLVAVAVWVWVPRSPIYSRSQIDWAGAVLLAGGLAALMLAISEGNAWGWGTRRVLALLVGAGVLIGAWVVWERAAIHPLVDLRLLARRSIWRANAAGLAAGVAYFIPFALVPLIAGYPEATGYGLGLTSTQVALVLAPGSAAALVAGIAGGRLVTVVGARRQAILANVFVIASYTMFLILPKTPRALGVALLPLGVGLGLGMGAIINLTLRASDQREAAVTAGLNTVVRTVGQALGPQVAVAVVISVPVLATGLPAEAGFDRGFLFGLVAAVGALAAAWIVPAAGYDPLLSPHSEPRANGRATETRRRR